MQNLNLQAIEIGKGKEKGIVFENQPITDADVLEICKNKHLVNITLKNTKITDKALEYLATLPKLQLLWISKNAITGEGFSHFLEHQKLDTIDLSFTQLDDEILKIVAQIPKLRFLHLEGTKVSFDGLLAVAKHKNLNIGAKSQFSDEQMQIFKQTQRNFAKKKTAVTLSEEDLQNAKNHLLAFFKAIAEWEKFAHLNFSKGLQSEMTKKIQELYQKYTTEKHHHKDRHSWSGMDGGTYGEVQLVDYEVVSKNKFYIYGEDEFSNYRFLMLRQKDNSWRIESCQIKFSNWEKCEFF